MLWYVTMCVSVSMVMGEGQQTGSIHAVGCFKCNSFNNSDPGCGDPFNPGYSTYEPKCKAGWKGRVGGFPARFCIKMSGFGVKNGVELTVRDCSLKNFHNHCGTFDFAGELYSGCVLTCDRSGCNHGKHVVTRLSWIQMAVITCVSVITMTTLAGQDILLLLR